MNNFVKFSLGALALTLCLTGETTVRRPGGFVVVGPGGGGAQYQPTISPHDSRKVLVYCDMTGGYLSEDGGGSWRMFNLRAGPRFFVYDPVDPQTIYVQTNGLWRSTDAAKTWKLVYPKPEALSGVSMPDDHADEVLMVGGKPAPVITALVVDPANRERLFAVMRGNGASVLSMSGDQGATWKQITTLPRGGKKLWLDTRSPESARTLIAAGDRVVQRVVAGVVAMGQELPEAVVDISGGRNAEGAPYLYAVTEHRAFYSEDSGATWQSAELPGSPQFHAIATSAFHPETAYVSFSEMQGEGGPFFGIAKTTDWGRTWRLVWKENNQPASNVHDSWITPRFGTHWGDFALTLGVAPRDPDLAYATDLGRTMRTHDGGVNWEAVYSRKAPDGGYVSNGLDVTNAYGIHYDPFDSKRIFMSLTDIGLFRSEDGGQSWISSTDGVPERWTNTTYWVEFDPVVKGRMWGVMSGTHDLPRPKMWRRTSTSRYQGGVCRSDDGGRTWQKSSDGMPETAPTHILLDPTSRRDSRTLYATAMGRGVYKSTDGGKTWTLKNQGITQQDPLAWRLARDANGVLYLVIARRSEHGEHGNAGDGALYRSTDGAESWQRVALPADVNGPNGLLPDRRDPSRLYLAAWPRSEGLHGVGGGIYLSTDAGATWKRIFENDQHIYDVTDDPRRPDILYASGFESSAWRSTDRGERWTRIPGYNFKWGHRVVPDHDNPSMVWITTFGGGVWHGAWNGDANATLDIATPELRLGGK